MEVRRIHRPGQRSGRAARNGSTGNIRRLEEAAAKTILVRSDLDNSAVRPLSPWRGREGAAHRTAYQSGAPARVARPVPPRRVRPAGARAVQKARKRGNRLSDASGTGAARGARINRAAPESGQIPSPGRGNDQDNRGHRAVCGLRADRSQLHRSVFHVRQASGWHQEARGLQHQSAVRTRQRHRRKRQPGSQLYRSRQRRQTSGCLRVVRRD